MSRTSARFSRRRFLRGAGGAALSLPWLESLTLGAGGARSPIAPPLRFAYFYVPIGVVRRGFFPGESDSELLVVAQAVKKVYGIEHAVGHRPIEWTPTLEPLKDLEEHVTLITGLDRVFQSGTDVHAQCASCFMSSAAPYSIESSAWPLDRTLDQILADQIGGQTPFRSLELSCNSHKDNKESIYFDNISWYGTGHVAPSLRDPRRVYQRLFGSSNVESLRNVTDLVLADARAMKRGLGKEDRHKFNEYFESVRAIETQMDRLEAMRVDLDRVPMAEPSVAHLPRGEYIRLMGDLMVVALQTGMTNVATLMVGPERWDTPFTYESLFDKPRSHHKMSHNPEEFVEDLLRVDRFHMEQFAYLVRRLRDIEEADGSTLLDNTLFTYGSGLGDGSSHQYDNLPIVVAGSAQGRLRTGSHLHCPPGTPLANLWLAHTAMAGIERDRFADSTGTLPELLS